MSIKNHPAYNEEFKRLEYTKALVESSIERITANKEKYLADMKQAMIDLDYLDSSQSYITILTTSEFMRLDQNSYDNLLRARTKPYFSRIDFKSSKGQPKKYYIGKMSLVKEDDKEPVIIDWRSPVANVYYEGRLGHVSYNSPMGNIEGELLLKRQFTMGNGQLENFIDIDITTNDTFLQYSLDAHADDRLKDIASTIQAEQNRIIRADGNIPLIVQGVAGSGKTTIALHRIAYLIYTYHEQFIPENFMIMAPNRLFLNYISEVLPELGVERIKQTTYIDFILELIGHKYKLTNTNEKLIKLLDTKSGSEAQNHLLIEGSSFKGSLSFKLLLDNYLDDITLALIPLDDFALDSTIIFSQAEIKNLFIKEYGFMPLNKRIELLKKVLANKLKNAKPKLLESIEEQYNREIERIRNKEADSEEKRQKLIALMDERDERIKTVSNAAKTITAKYIAKFPKIDLFDCYRDIITNEEALKKYSPSEMENGFASYISSYSNSILAEKHIEFEDLAPLAYLHYRIFGLKEKIEVKHVVIDEAQDFSVFQFYILKTILNSNLFTILGDLSQSIFAYRGMKSWQEVIDEVFKDDSCAFLTLEQSYRTTVEIMELANRVISFSANPDLILAKPVIRHGEKPELKEFSQGKDLVDTLSDKLRYLKEKDYKSFAIICKTANECRKIKQALQKDGIVAKVLSGEEKTYESGVIILPSYIAKGFEFDVVFIVNLEDDYLHDDLDLKLLYVAMTRALHRLYVYYTKDKLSLLGRI